MIRVVVGEDNYIAREGISRALEEEVDVEVVATCADLPSLRAAVGEARPDVVLADIRMPPTKTDEGVRLAAELRVTHPDVGVVILSQYAEPLYATELLEAGSVFSKLGLGESEQVSRRVKVALLYLAG
jgi:DNA-binding NarL/FixJ family response regulator